jgi:hypothetical protein
MIGFSIQRNHVFKEETTVINYCILNKIPYKLCNGLADSPKGYIPCGTVEWIDSFLPKEKTIPDYYPEFAHTFLYRKVWKSTNSYPNSNCFIKPADKHKRFNGYIYIQGRIDFPVWCSEVVTFTNEWRYYISNGKILLAEWYSGDELLEPDAPDIDIKIPTNFCGTLDVGTLDTGEIALVEAYPPYACGWYGKKHKVFINWLINGWEYLQK